MSRKYIFLVHGVGNHFANSWSDSWKAAIFRALAHYAPYSSMSTNDLDKHIALVPIGYDSVFETYRKQWGDLAGALADNDVLGSPALQTILQWVADYDQTESNGAQFFWNNVLDAVLWFAYPQCRAAVIAKVTEQFTAGLRDMYKENHGTNTSHVLAHSLGTSVTHDALISLRYADSIHEGSLDSTQHKWRSIYMLANTSRLLQAFTKTSDKIREDEYKPYTSNIKPGARAAAICMNYANVRHRIDPITWPRRFAPADWPFSSYSDIEITHYNRPNEVHDPAHYMANPRVHLPFFRHLFQRSTLGTADEVKQALSNFRHHYPKEVADQFIELQDLLKRDFDRKLTVQELAEFLFKAFKKLQ